MFNLEPAPQRYLTTAFICQSLSGTAVALRFYCQIKFKNGVHVDDYLMVATLLSTWAMNAAEIWGAVAGSQGKNTKDFDPKTMMGMETARLKARLLVRRELGSIAWARGSS